MRSKYWLYVVVWLLILLVLSSDSFSYNATRKITKGLFEFFNPNVQLRTILTFHEFLRKTLHVLNYAFLSWLLLCAWARSFHPISKWRGTVAMGIIFFCAIYSASDEWRQSFSNVRTSRVLDVFLDTGGAILTQLICWIVYQVKKFNSQQ
jgi:VanZ family protein